MIAPKVHLNGSSRETLREGYRDAADAVLRAREALRDTRPNARDYYPQGDAAYTKAVAEHMSRCHRIQSVLDELRALCDAVEE